MVKGPTALVPQHGRNPIVIIIPLVIIKYQTIFMVIFIALVIREAFTPIVIIIALVIVIIIVILIVKVKFLTYKNGF